LFNNLLHDNITIKFSFKISSVDANPNCNQIFLNKHIHSNNDVHLRLRYTNAVVDQDLMFTALPRRSLFGMTDMLYSLSLSLSLCLSLSLFLSLSFFLSLFCLCVCSAVPIPLGLSMRTQVRRNLLVFTANSNNGIFLRKFFRNRMVPRVAATYAVGVSVVESGAPPACLISSSRKWQQQLSATLKRSRGTRSSVIFYWNFVLVRKFIGHQWPMDGEG
jgi:hypothetical protein